MESNAHFLLGVHLADPAADPLVFEFQQEVFSDERLEIHITQTEARGLGADDLVDAVSSRYLHQYPAEQQRVGQKVVYRCVRAALEKATR